MHRFSNTSCFFPLRRFFVCRMRPIARWCRLVRLCNLVYAVHFIFPEVLDLTYVGYIGVCSVNSTSGKSDLLP